MPVESKTRTPVFGLTCTPGGIFIQLRQQSSILLKMPGGRLLLKSSLSPVRGVWEVRAETRKNPLSLSEIVLVRKAFMTHIAKGHLTLLKGKGTREYSCCWGLSLCVQIYFSLRSHLTALLATKRYLNWIIATFTQSADFLISFKMISVYVGM